MKIMVTIDLKEDYLSKIRETAPEALVVKAVDMENQKREIQNSEVIIAFGDSLSMELLPEAVNLKWLQSWAAGVDNFTTPEVMKQLIDNNVKLTTMSGIHGDVIAEHTMGLVISFSRKLHKFYEQQQKGIWQRLKVDQLEGKTMAIIGLGSIGMEISRKAQVFKMHTIGVKKNVNENIDCVDELYSNDELLSVLNKADYVVVIVPLTDETTHMFGKEEFQAMKETAYFINMARGQVVNEEELILALEEAWIAGAGLDVFEEEPLPAASPLYRLDNVLITPHVGGIHPDYHKKALQVFLKNLERYQQGLELENLVDYNRGY